MRLFILVTAAAVAVAMVSITQPLPGSAALAGSPHIDTQGTWANILEGAMVVNVAAPGAKRVALRFARRNGHDIKIVRVGRAGQVQLRSRSRGLRAVAVRIVAPRSAREPWRPLWSVRVVPAGTGRLSPAAAARLRSLVVRRINVLRSAAHDCPATFFSPAGRMPAQPRLPIVPESFGRLADATFHRTSQGGFSFDSFKVGEDWVFEATGFSGWTSRASLDRMLVEWGCHTAMIHLPNSEGSTHLVVGVAREPGADGAIATRLYFTSAV